MQNSFFIICIYLLIFQGILSEIIPIFLLGDEIVALFGVLFLFLKRKRINKNYKYEIFFLGLFVLSGIYSSVIYKYQSYSLAIEDLFTNIKFYLILYFGFSLNNKNYRINLKKISKHLRIISQIMIILFIIDRILGSDYSEIRFGIKSAKMFYGHSTYLAGSMVGLITGLTYFYNPKNFKYIITNLIILFFTLRGKAIGAFVVYVFLYILTMKINKKLKIRDLLFGFIIIFLFTKERLYFYYIKLAGQSARSVMTLTSLKIMEDYFPVGTGFATYGSSLAGKHYSPIYLKYGFDKIYELSSSNPNAFFNDTFWPIILGQTGFIGTVSYLLVLGCIFNKILKFSKINRYISLGGIFSFTYLMISSTSEPAFNNSIAALLALLLGYILSIYEDFRSKN